MCHVPSHPCLAEIFQNGLTEISSDAAARRLNELTNVWEQRAVAYILWEWKKDCESGR